MEDQDKSYFSLDDSDEEIVEEEVIDRDEEYEDDDYDDEYDDEEYDEEEDYDDEGDYEDEDYDDGYSDDYYDDRLNKVLDEIAEIKRGMAPSTAVASQQPQPPFIPQYIYQPNSPTPSANSEVVMYNEISRLRDELAKNQSSLEMQKEITRMKEDMARDQKFAESQYNAEIKRLQDRIDDLLKNAPGPQSEQLPPAQQDKPLRLEGGKSFDKLITINEAVLRATKDSDAHIRNEIEQLKAKLESLPSGEALSKLVENAKSATEGADAELVGKLAKDLEEIKKALGEYSSVNRNPIELKVERGNNGDDVSSSELLRQLYEIKLALGAASDDAVSHTQKLLELVGEYKTVERAVRSQSVAYRDKLNAVSSFGKKLVEANDPSATELADAVNALAATLGDYPLTRSSYSDLSGFCSDSGAVAIPQQTRDDAEKFFTLCDRLGGNISETFPELIAQKNKLENNAFAAENNEIANELSKQLAAEKRDDMLIKSLVTKAQLVRIGAIATLPAIELKAAAPSDENGAERSESLFTKLSELKAAIEAQSAVIADSKSAIEAQSAAIAENKSVIEAQSAAIEKGSSAIEAQNEAIKKQSEQDDFPFKEIRETEVKDDFMADPDADKVARTTVVTAEVSPEYKESLDKVNVALSELREALKANTSTDNVGDALEEVRSNYVQLSERLVAISESIAKLEPAQSSAEPTAEKAENTEYAVERVDDTAATAQTSNNEELLSNLEFIRDKLNEYEAFLSQIGELRKDVSNISSAIDFTEQFNTQLNEIASQFDKLYEDISNVVIESETNVINHIDGMGLVEAVDGAKAEILAETQTIKDALFAVNDAVVNMDSTGIAEVVDGAKAEILADTQTIRDTLFAVNDVVVNMDPAGVVEVVDGAKAEILADTQTIRDTLFAVNDVVVNMDPATVVEVVENAKAEILADTLALKDTLYVINDAVSNTQLNEAVENLRSDLSAFADLTAANVDVSTADRQKLLEDVAFIREQAEAALSGNTAASVDADAETVADDRVYSYLDDISARVGLIANISEDAAQTKDTVGIISDNVATVLDTLTPINENVAATLDALVPIGEQVSAILDRLDAASESVDVDEQGEVVIGDGGDDFTEDINEVKDNLNTILDTLPLLPQSDDLITARDNTYSILDTLTTMPSSEDVATIRDNVAAVLDAVRALSDSLNGGSAASENTLEQDVAVLRADTETLLSSVPESLGEDVIAIRDSIAELPEDVKFIRQKLEEPTSGSLESVVADISAILDRLESFEQTAADNKQEIVNAVASVREKIHINELDETMTAVGIDEQTRETLVTEISDVRERLTNIESATQSINDYNATLLDDISERLTALAQSLEGGSAASAPNGELLEQISDKLDALLGTQTETPSYETQDESLQAIADGLAVIKEKIDAQADYDAVAEILSLREDVKAARIVDQNEVSGELEAIKNELASISSGNILDEVRALRDDIAALDGGGISGDASNPTGGELNLVLNEIVSLRDEVFALRDEVLNATVEQSDEAETVAEAEPVETDDSIGIILDELTALRVDQNTLGENINELKDAISRRTKLETTETADGEVKTSDELNVVLDEIINLKNEIEQVGETVASDRFDEIAAQVAELRELIETAHVEPAVAEPDESINENFGVISEQLDNINAAISDIRLDRAAETGDVSGSLAEKFDGLYAEIDELKAVVSAIAPADVSSDITELRTEIEQLRAENEQLRSMQNDGISEQLAELREAIRDMAIATPTVTDSGETSYAALIDEIRALRDEMTVSKAPAVVSMDNDAIESLRDALAEQTETNVPLAEELGEIRDEIAQLRSLATVTADNSGSIAEIAAMRSELAELRSMLSSSDNLYGLAEDVTVIRSDVQTLKDEPDLGVMNEILALRDEFQALREEIEDVKRVAGQTDVQSDEKILAEVQSLRDQLFAISMANVNDSMSGETNYESYNNLILDELTSLQASIAAAGSSDEIQSITDELADLRASIDKREALYDALARRVARLDNDATNNKILEALDSLHSELANQREADLTTLNFMSEMAHLLERQNSYIAQNTGSKISDEIESLKAELATTDTVAEEIAKLREFMSNTGDNDAILNELAELKEQMNAEKPSKENELILQEIARLRDEMTSLGERESRRTVVDDADLSDSLSDLKSQLNEIADIIEPEKSETQKTAPSKRGRPKGASSKSKSASKSKSGSKKSGGASSGKKSNRGRKPKAATVNDTAVAETPIYNDSLEAKIDEQSAKLGVNRYDDIPSTKVVSDRHDKLAQRVANKLIIEQLVEQLGEDGKTDDQVDRILGNLPNELTTVALDEQSEQVRKLANELAESKLRERLRSKSDEDDE